MRVTLNSTVQNKYHSTNILVQPYLNFYKAFRNNFALYDNGVDLAERVAIAIVAPFAFLTLGFLALIGLCIPSLNTKTIKQKKDDISPETKSIYLNLCKVNNDPKNVASFTFPIELDDETEKKFNQAKYAYSESLYCSAFSQKNLLNSDCSLKYENLKNKNYKIWSLVDRKGNTFSVLKNEKGQFLVQVLNYQKPLEILIDNL